MISVSGRLWQEKKINKNLVDKLKQDFDFSEILSKLIISRNFSDREIYSIDNEILIKNVFKNVPDFQNATTTIIKAINKHNKICILGDYDVDGSVATALVCRFLDSINHPYFYYIPDREKDGYGASKKLFEKLLIQKPKLIIMVDCGSTSIEAINFLNLNNIQSIVIDHHQINCPYPLATNIINPKKNNGYEEYDYLCASALTYFFLEILIKKINSNLKIKDYLIYVLLATVCDVMPIRNLNRLIAKKLLSIFQVNNDPIIKEIFKQLDKNNKLTINDLGYIIGPILNSGGRLGKSDYATKLLISNDENEISKKTKDLIELNEKRKIIENRILNEIDFKKIEIEHKDIIILYEPNINEGLIGIIASRLKDHFNKPSIVITNSNSLLKGSARSTVDLDIGLLIKKTLDEDLILSGGGHKMAGGFTLKKKKLNNFKNYINKNFIKNKSRFDRNLFFYDAAISSSALNKDFYHSINKLEPFGTENHEPLFLFKDIKILKPKILKKKHISCILKSSNGYSIKTISFNNSQNKIGEFLLNYKKEVNVIGQISENFWNNKNTLQLIVKDLII